MRRRKGIGPTRGIAVVVMVVIFRGQDKDVEGEEEGGDEHDDNTEPFGCGPVVGGIGTVCILIGWERDAVLPLQGPAHRIEHAWLEPLGFEVVNLVVVLVHW